MAVAIVVLAVSSFFTAHYLAFPPEELFAILIFALSAVAARFVWAQVGRSLLVMREVVGIGLFALMLDISLVLGYHIVTDVPGMVKFGLSSEVFISPYSWVDAAALVAMLPSLFVVFFGLYHWIKGGSRTTPETAGSGIDLSPIGAKGTLALAGLVFLAWLPYLLIYFPGFVFNDSLDSIRQCLGIDAYNNHHPFLYTMLIDGCLSVGRALGVGNTGGCAIYCIVQMACMACVVAYLSRWVVRRAGISHLWGWAIGAVFAVSPYVATFSIAIWKDPLFTMAMVVVTLMLADLLMSKGSIPGERRWFLPVLAAAMLAIAFLRNNGVFIVVLVGVSLLVVALSRRRHPEKGRAAGFAAPAGIAAAVTAACVVVTGPVYGLIGVADTESVEVVGMQLNQMARVVVMDGDMTDENRAYMASLMPLDEYVQVYTPATVDNLKWADGFNADAVRVDGEFVKNWATMMANNPRTCFEAWELQTFGFWAINQSDITSTFKNIRNGWPILPGSERIGLVEEVDIEVGNVLGVESLKNVFPQEPQSIPLSIVLWGMLYLALCMVLLKRGSWLVALVPALALMATLLVASPMWYWPRYAATLHFLIPFFWFAFRSLARCSRGAEEACVPREGRLLRSSGKVRGEGRELGYNCLTDSFRRPRNAQCTKRRLLDNDAHLLR